MIYAFLRRLATRENGIFLLLLMALLPLPLAAGRFVPDARLSLLLPVTLVGALIAYGLASIRIRDFWIEIVFLVYGPLAVFVRIAEIFDPLLKFAQETLLIFSKLIFLSRDHIPLDLSNWLTSQSEMRDQIIALSQRLIYWISGTWRGVYVEDPAVRALLWCLGLWLIAVWAGWQVKRHGQALIGLLPATVLLAIILDFTIKSSGILWLHLSAFLLLLGLTNYERLISQWKQRRMDFSDSTWEDTLIATLVLTATLVSVAFIVSPISIKDVLDKMRERQIVSAHSSLQASAPRSAQTTTNSTTSRVTTSLQSGHSIPAGPKLSKTVVMVISTGDFPSMPTMVNIQVPRYYWRTMTYQTYVGSGWINPDEPNVEIPPDEPLTRAFPAPYRVIHQQVTFPSGSNGGLYWTGALIEADTPLQVAWRTQPQDDPAATGNDPLLGADLIGAISSVQSYSAVSLLPEVSEAELRAAPASYPDWVSQRYLQLPDSVPERVRALARDLTAGSITTYDRALAIQNYLREIPYSLDVPTPPIGRDATDFFLFNLKKGYCDYYATAMTVLARAAGLPARFVIGYASGTYDPFNARYVVVAADAHAWTEIYFSGIGWIEFEPTAGQPALIRSEQADTLPAMSSISSQPVQTQTPLALIRFSDFVWRPFAIILFLFFLWMWSDGLRLSLRDPAAIVQQIYQRLRRLARPLRGYVPPSETAHEYAAALSARLSSLRTRNGLWRYLLASADAQIHLITHLYNQSLFAPRIPSRAEARRALQSWRRLRWRLWITNIMIIMHLGH